MQSVTVIICIVVYHYYYYYGHAVMSYGQPPGSVLNCMLEFYVSTYIVEHIIGLKVTV